VTNEEIAQKWITGLSVVRHHMAVVSDQRVWQSSPAQALAATDRINGLKEWCLKVMEAMPEMREKFLEDIDQRGGTDAGTCDPTFLAIQQAQQL